MNKKKTYWKWKNTIIDFNNISDEKADFGDHWTKKEMVFHYLGIPDDEIQRKLGYSCGNICEVCNCKRKSAYGYIWRYVKYE